jgi:ribonucleotide reductase alpha subunit
MRSKSHTQKDSVEKTVRDIRRATRRRYSAEEKIRTLLVPTGSPLFFESYVAAAALIEVIIARLVSRAGKNAVRQIEQVDRLRYALGEYWEQPD